MNERNTLDWLQALRGVAALVVVFFYMGPHWALVPAPVPFTPAMHCGFVDVEVFFVLCGFVLFSSARSIHSTAALVQFVKRRALHIYLGYWPLLLLVAVGSVWILDVKLPDTPKMRGIIFLLYPCLTDNWLPTAWSLMYELYFYGWIVCIVLLPVRKRLFGLVFAFSTLMVWNTGWLLFQTHHVYQGNQGARFLLSGFGLEFPIDVSVAEIFKGQGYDWPRAVIAFPMCIALACLGFSAGTTGPLFAQVETMRIGSFGLFALATANPASALGHRSSSK